MVMRDFTELSTNEVLALAIVIEERNRDLYTEWAARFRSYDLAASVLLEELAKEEEDHRAYLIKRYIEQFGSSVIRINPACVNADLELQQLPAEHFFVVDVPMALSILRAVLDCEEKAMKFYKRVLSDTKNPKLGAIYEPLVEFEAGHVKVVEEWLETYVINSYTAGHGKRSEAKAGSPW